MLMLDDFRPGLSVWGSVGFSWSVEGENQATGTEMEKNHHAQCMMPDFFIFFLEKLD